MGRACGWVGGGVEERACGGDHGSFFFSVVPLLSSLDLSVELSAHSLIANWTLPRDVVIRNAILSFIVTVSESDSEQLVIRSSALPRNTSSYEVSGLRAFTRYTVHVEVRGVNNAIDTVKNVTTLESGRWGGLC